LTNTDKLCFFVSDSILNIALVVKQIEAVYNHGERSRCKHRFHHIWNGEPWGCFSISESESL